MKNEKNRKQNTHKMWDPISNQIVEEDKDFIDGVFENHTHVYTEAGEKEGFFRYYVVFPVESKINLERISHVETIAKTISCVEFEHLTELESLEIHPTHLVASVLISPEIAVVEYIESIIDMSRELDIMLSLEHFVTNIKKPTEAEIQSFIKQTLKFKN